MVFIQVVTSIVTSIVALPPCPNDHQPEDVNAATLAAYDSAAQRYHQHTSTHLSLAMQQWLTAALDHLASGEAVLEIGSGQGRDATWIEQRGYRVVRTEASKGLRQLLREQGHAVAPLNALTDEVDQRYAMIHAGAVLHHFPPNDLREVLRRIHRWLLPGGVFTCSVKQSEGEQWETDKLGLPRHFCYWQPDARGAELAAAGLPVVWVNTEEYADPHRQWIMTSSQKPHG